MYNFGDIVNFIVDDEDSEDDSVWRFMPFHIKNTTYKEHKGMITDMYYPEIDSMINYTIVDCKSGVYYYAIQDWQILTNKKENKQMKKNDLKNRMVVEMRNGEKYLVVDDYLFEITGKGYMTLDCYQDDLMNKSSSRYIGEEEINRSYDIMKVYQQVISLEEYWLNDKNIIWERKKEEPVEMTFEEIKTKLGIENLRIVGLSSKDFVYIGSYDKCVVVK